MGKFVMLRYLYTAVAVLAVGLPQVGYAQSRQQQQQRTPLEMQLQRLQAAVQQSADPKINPQTTPGTGVAAPLPEQRSVIGAAFEPPAPALDEFDTPLDQVEADSADPIPQIPVRNEAFTRMTKEILPFTSNQVTTLRDIFNQVQRAQASDPRTPPKPTSRSIIVDMSPGAIPNVIRMSSGFVTALVFTDSTGTPWPIAAYDLGDPRSFNIQWNKKNHILLIQAITMHKRGNLAVMLRGFDTPVMLDLHPGQRSIDYRVDLRIPQLGPNATVSTVSLPGKADPVLLNVLNGVPPQGAKKLDIDHFDGDIWYLGGNMYVRTRMTVVSPGWKATMSSSDGMHAYQISKTPVILASHHGKVRTLLVKGL